MGSIWVEYAKSEEMILIQFRGMWFVVGRHPEDKSPYPLEANAPGGEGSQLVSTPIQRFRVMGYEAPYVRLKYMDPTSKGSECEMYTDVHEDAIFSATRVGKESMISLATV